MKVLKFIGAALYGMIAANILRWVFYLITPFVMTATWWMIALCWIFCGGLIATFLSTLSTFLNMPTILLSNGIKGARVLPIISLVINGVSAVIYPFTNGVNGFLEFVLALSLALTALMIFGGPAMGLLTYNEED